jgi:hypothetical protein
MIGEAAGPTGLLEIVLDGNQISQQTLEVEPPQEVTHAHDSYRTEG